MFFSNLSIQDASLKDIPDIIQIADSEFGSEYFLRSEIEKNILKKNAFIRIVKLEQRNIIGFSLTLPYINEVEKILSLANIPDFPSPFPYKSALLKSIAVKKSMQKKGVGSILVEDVLKMTQSFAYIFTIAWKKGNTIPIERILHQHDFTLLKQIEKYWEKENKTKKFCCPECNTIPCQCDAVLFVKKFSEL